MNTYNNNNNLYFNHLRLCNIVCECVHVQSEQELVRSAVVGRLPYNTCQPTHTHNHTHHSGVDVSYWKAWLNRWVFKFFRKESIFAIVLKWAGSLFHRTGAAVWKALSPYPFWNEGYEVWGRFGNVEPSQAYSDGSSRWCMWVIHLAVHGKLELVSCIGHDTQWAASEGF